MTTSTSTASKNSANATPSTDQFLYHTQAFNADGIQRTPIAENSTVRISLPKSGLLNKFYLMITGSVTISGTVTSGTWTATPDARAPYGFIQRYKLSNNSAVILHTLSGGNIPTWLRYRTGVDYDQTNNFNINSSDALTALGQYTTSSSEIVPGANISAGTYSLNKVIEIPVSYNNAGSMGLINLQNENNEYQVELTLGSIISGLTATGGSTSIINTLVGTGLSYTLSNFNIQVKCDLFAIVQNVPANLSRFMFVQDTTKVTANGDGYFDMPNSELYTLIIAKFVNNGVYVPWAQVANKIEMQYGGNRVRYSRQPQELIGVNWSNSNFETAPENGCYAFDMQHRKTDLRMQDVYDAFNDANATDFRLHYNLAMTTPSNPYVSVISESLRSAI